MNVKLKFVGKNVMSLEDDGWCQWVLCDCCVNELNFSNLIKRFLNCVQKFHEFIFRTHCAVMPLHF
jgi:hypothetical protein